jgi:catechol 2,3-dioxygenase-like lactoylglutathione lyase family enzyme
MVINGIGGVFIYANDPRSLAEWYSYHLGIEFTHDETSDNYYMVFFYRDVDDASKRLDTTFAIMPGIRHLGSDRGEFMINFRVNDVEALATQLATAGIVVGRS